MADNYIILINDNISKLHSDANDLVNKGYIPSGAITQVPYKSSFKLEATNYIDYNSSSSNMRITFMQSFYKPQINSI